METNIAPPKREKLVIGGFETWVEYNGRLCSLILFGIESSKHGVVLDVMGLAGHKYVTKFIYNGGYGGHAKLTEQEQKELNNYINNEKRDNNKRI